jgi:hypothetical protein
LGRGDFVPLCGMQSIIAALNGKQNGEKVKKSAVHFLIPNFDPLYPSAGIESI